MIPSNGLKRKSTSVATQPDGGNPITTSTVSATKRFRGSALNGKIPSNADQMSYLSSEQLIKMTICNSKQEMTSEHRQLQYELQCQEALLLLMQKLKANQQLSSTNAAAAQRTAAPVNATKASPVAPVKPSSSSTHRTIPTKPSQPHQHTANRTNNTHSQQPAAKPSASLPQATRQSNPSTVPTTATRLSTTVVTPPVSAKTSSVPSTSNSSSKNNGINSDQHLLTAKLALRKQLEQTLLQIPTPKPTTCDLTYIPGINGWSEFLTFIGLEQALSTCGDFLNRRLAPEFSFNLPNVCAQCGTDWSVTWHDVSSADESDAEEKILCDRCRKTSQKKILKQDHSNRLRQAFMKALQQEKELDVKFQQQSATPTKAAPSPSPSTSSASSHSKHSSKPSSTKTSSSHSSSKHSNNHHHHHHHRQSQQSQQQQHHHHHSSKSSSSKHVNPMETFAATLAALPTNEQLELFQQQLFSNIFPFAAVNQAAALAAKSTQQQQQALAASLPAMAASLMRQGNPAQYLLDMIPQAAKQQQQHHRHSK